LDYNKFYIFYIYTHIHTHTHTHSIFFNLSQVSS